MAPRSWKPDFSLTDTVDVEDVDKDEAEDDRASSVMAYHAYRSVTYTFRMTSWFVLVGHWV